MILSNRKTKLIWMTELSILTAIVMILQILGVGIRLPFLTTPISLVLIPIVLGAAILGPAAGAWLGFVFGMVVYITLGVMGGDPTFTAILFQNHPVLTFVVCIGKGVLAGLAGGWIYRLLQKKNSILAIFAASAVVPMVNTGVFILLCFTMMDTFEENLLAGMNMWYFLVVLCAGVNFVAEFLVNMIFSPAIHRVVEVVNKRLVK